MEFDFKGYCFSFDNDNKELEKFIGNYQDLKKTIKQVFKISDDTDINISYIDCDGCFDISSQNSYNQVLSYHTHKYEEFINILVKKQIKLNNDLPNGHHGINFEEEFGFSKDRSLLENTNKDIAILRTELHELKKGFEDNKKDMLDAINSMLENSLKKSEERIVKTVGKTDKLTYSQTPSFSSADRSNSLIVIKENNFEIQGGLHPDDGEDFAYNDHNDVHEVDGGDINYLEKSTPQFFCCICNSLDITPKFTCMICTSFYICPYCEMEHSNHPLITLVQPTSFYNKEKLALYVSNEKNKSFKKYFNSIKNFFTRKGVLQMQLVLKSEVQFMKPLQKCSIEITIFNLSSSVILEDELLITAVNNGSFKVESKLVSKAIDKYDGNTTEKIVIQAPNRSGIYNFDLILLHDSKKLEYDTVQMKITVATAMEDFFSCDKDLEVYFRGYPNIRNKLNVSQKFEIKNMIEDKITNLSLFKIDNILQTYNYDYDKAMNKIFGLK
jgi:hypothetical protein